ncbi:MAG: glycosyltransferase family 2 protein, partial [Deltaproteobacteria bacterium]|nr:glycosyltransferase family 2 protein [Deltaproteobacteria bacterium]
CIATFRRPRGLARLLDSLARLVLPEGLVVEIVVVDNDAAGDAQSRALAACESARTARWFVEPRQNIALARNRSVSEARGRWIAFIDDDEVADGNWLVEFWKCVERGEGDGFFGPVLPRLEEVATPWLDVETFYSRPRHSSGTRIAVRDASTSNALVRRSLFAGYRFDPGWGRTGGEDNEIFDRMLAAGVRLLWCDEAIVCETIPACRHRLGWLTQRAFRGGVGFTRLQRQHRRSGAVWRGLPRALLAHAVLVPLLPLALLAGRPAAARVWLRICTQAGHLWAFAGRSYEEYGYPAARVLPE